MRIILIILIISILQFSVVKSASCPEKDTTMVNNAINRIENQILLFNKANQELFRRIIMKKYNTSFTEDYISQSEIIAEPNFDFDVRLLHLINQDSLDKIGRYSTTNSPYYQFIVRDKDSSIYNYFIGPVIDTNNIKINLRLYDEVEKQKEFLKIFETPDYYTRNGKGEMAKAEPMLMRIPLYDTTSELFYGWNIRYGLPKSIFTFNLNISDENLYRCVLYDKVIYSVECLQRKYPKEKLYDILKRPKETTCDCDIDNYLKYVIK